MSLNNNNPENRNPKNDKNTQPTKNYLRVLKDVSFLFS